MPFIPTPNTCQVEMVYDYLAQIVENVFHVDLGAPPTVANMSPVLADFMAWHATQLRNQQHSSALLTKIRVRDISQQTGTAIEEDCNANCAGAVTGGGAAMPGNVTLAVKWNTGLAGRSFRGRTYHIGLYDDAVTGNFIIPGVHTGLFNIYNAIPYLDAPTFPKLVVVSKYTNNNPRPAGIRTPIIGATINDAIDSQRRRLPERGR